jgi:hypothetical protein
MPFKLIKGEFHIFYPDQPRNGPQPDGDTVKFKPDNRLLVETLKRDPGARPEFNAKGMINLRFEAIDALELHFAGSNQNLDWAKAGRDALLREIGFGAVTYFPDKDYVANSVEFHPIRGYILASSIESNGRIVSFVFTGDTPEIDGSEVWVDTARIAASLNLRQLEGGLAYPVFYSSLPMDLMQYCAQASIAARTAAPPRGMLPFDTMNTTTAAHIPDLAAVEQLVIWPKAARRLISYFSAGNVGLALFDAWLRADPASRDDQLILPNRELGNMHDIFEIVGDTIKMKYHPEEIIILPDGATVITPQPQPNVPAPTLTRGDVRVVAALVNPLGNDVGKESVTLLNTTPQAVDLTGWTVANAANKRLALGGMLEAGAALHVPLSTRVPLSNNGGTITLFNAADQQVDQVSYKARDAARSGWTLVF